MSLKVLILGTGKMGHDVGRYLLKMGNSVTWVSRHTGRFEKFVKKIDKEIRRHSSIQSQNFEDFDFDFVTYDNLPDNHFELIIETVTEDLELKRSVVNSIRHLLKNETILASNSSSILPEEISENLVGLHFFYPLELTNLVEVIFPSGITQALSYKIISILEEWGINYITQNQKNAFAINRLMLPLQNEVFRLLQEGWSPKFIEDSSISKILPFGQLSFMDNIGFDVLLPSVRTYISRMAEELKIDYQPLDERLRLLTGNGKLGKKNKNGLLIGDPLPWKVKKHNESSQRKLDKHFGYLFINTCSNFLNYEQIKLGELNLVFDSLYNSEIHLLKFISTIDYNDLKNFLAKQFEQTKLSYFIPVSNLVD